MKTLLLGAVALAAAIPATAQAQPAPQAPVMIAPSAPPMAPRAQRPHTRNEVVAKVRDHFAKVDTNRDGFVTTAEMDARRGQNKLARQAGQGGNRRAMRDGARGNPGAAFDRLDANRDGMISRDEFGKAREMRSQRKLAMKGAGAPGARGGRMMKMHRMGGMMGGRMLRMADLDRDGRVSLQEATTKALQHFDQADANRDGQITPDERRTIRQQMIERRRTQG
jgi:Ca2+-binding EF-hand superfamily protein